MNRRHALIPLTLITLSVGTSLWSRDSAAERAKRPVTFEAIPMRQGDLITLESALRSPGVMELATLSVQSANLRAGYIALCQSSEAAMTRALEDMERGRYERAEALLRVLLDQLSARQDAQAAHDQAMLLLARVLSEGAQPHEALSILEAIPKTTPIEDYRLWQLAQTLEKTHQYARAAQTYDELAARADSPMAHRARVNHALATFLAKDYRVAIKALEQINELYPDYPRRYVALLYLGQSFEATNQPTKAAQTFQQLWFEYPFRAEGEWAHERLERLIEDGVKLEPQTVAQRYARYRWLRINKHWDTARQLFLELAKEEHEANGKHSALSHEIAMQLGLNAYIPKEYDEALGYFESLVTDYEAGQREGIDAELTYTYYARTLAKVGRMEEALRALNKAHARDIERTRDQKRAEFLAEHGQYKEALKLLEPITPPGQQKGWSYTWLLYKSHKFKEARENLKALALRSTGKTRAKYQYWAARAADRLNSLKEAEAGFKEVIATSATSYYGIQASNRLVDLQRRKTLNNNQLLVNTARVERSASVAIDALEALPQPEAPHFTTLAISERAARQLPRNPDQPMSAFGGIFEPTSCEPELEQSTLLCEIATNLNAPTKPPDAVAAPDPLAAPDDPDEPALIEAPEQGPTLTGALPVDPQAPLPRAVYTSKDNARYHFSPQTQARIYWGGPDESTLEFARYEQGQIPGPKPSKALAYTDKDYLGGIDRAADKYGDLFPELERARWLKRIGLLKEARWAVRHVSLEYRALYRLPSPRSAPHQLPYKRMTPLIDNRRNKAATWGYQERELRWPIPEDAKGRAQLLARQQTIISKKRDMLPVLIDAFKDVGDYYMVRRMTLEMRPPTKSSAERLSQLYPRAFPELVTKAAKKYGVNPYVVWALMTVESSYNPDSVSTAEALGLLQVIPRTGLKIAQLLGDDRFGHYDLLDEDVAIEHGVFYIAQVIRKFNGQELFSFAGYNGGPHRVAEWLDQRGDMPLDEFVEEIPYDQAREYTKKVTYFIGLYMRLYERVDELYVGQDIDREYKRMPNF